MDNPIKVTFNTMIKRFYILIIFSLCTVTVTAQIQRNIFDFTLGVTTKTQVQNYLIRHHYNYSINKNGEYEVRNLIFAGHNWPSVYFSFYNDKFYCVDFIDNESHTPVETLGLVWKRLNSSLNKKYSIYSISSKDDYVEFSDNKTNVSLKFRNTLGEKMLSIMYYDIFLLNQMISSEESEL